MSSLVLILSCMLTIILILLHRDFHRLSFLSLRLLFRGPDVGKVFWPMHVHYLKSELLVGYLVQLACMTLNFAESASIPRPKAFLSVVVIEPAVNAGFLNFTFPVSMIICFAKRTFKLLSWGMYINSS